MVISRIVKSRIIQVNVEFVWIGNERYRIMNDLSPLETYKQCVILLVCPDDINAVNICVRDISGRSVDFHRIDGGIPVETTVNVTLYHFLRVYTASRDTPYNNKQDDSSQKKLFMLRYKDWV